MISDIRPAAGSDASAIALLSLEVWAATYLRQGINGFFADYALDHFSVEKVQARLNAGDRNCWVSHNAVGLEGYVELDNGSIPPLDGVHGTEISTLYVRSAHHKCGRGSALLQTALDFTRQAGRGGVWLAVNAENDKAISFYRRHGFTNAGQAWFRIENEAYENFIMTLSFA